MLNLNKRISINYKISLIFTYSMLFVEYSINQVNCSQKNSNFSSHLRYLTEPVTLSSKTINSTTINYPKCQTNSDCSLHGVCNLSTGLCDCDYGYDSYLSKKIINSIIQNYVHENSNSTTSSSNQNSTGTNVYVVNLTISDITLCNYELKSKLSALMLSIFIGFGSEHFYLDNNSLAAAKFVFYIFCFALNIVMFIIYKCFPNAKTFIHQFSIWEVTYLGCGFILIFLWNIYDWVNIGFDNYSDGNGFKMLPFSRN